MTHIRYLSILYVKNYLYFSLAGFEKDKVEDIDLPKNPFVATTTHKIYKRSIEEEFERCYGFEHVFELAETVPDHQPPLCDDFWDSSDDQIFIQAAEAYELDAAAEEMSKEGSPEILVEDRLIVEEDRIDLIEDRIDLDEDRVDLNEDRVDLDEDEPEEPVHDSNNNEGESDFWDTTDDDLLLKAAI